MSENIAIISHKGGTGKTSLVQNLSYELGTEKKVLAVDLDPQSNLTIGCGLDPSEERLTVYHAMHEPEQTADAIISLDHFDLLPASLDLAFSEQQFAGHYDRNDKLKDVLSQVDQNYDYILIDSPPNLGFFAFNALTAASQTLITLQCQPYAFRALDSALQLVQLVQKTNPALNIKSVILTMYDRRVTLTKSVENAARGRFGDLIAETIIPINISIAEATLDGVPVAVYAPRAAGTEAYHNLAKELFDG